MLLEYWELGRSELNTPGDMGGEKNDRVAGDPHRRLRVKRNLTTKAKTYTVVYVSIDISRNLCIGEQIMHLLVFNA